MATLPDLPYGYSWCNYTPANVVPTGGSVGVLETSYPGWTVKEYVGEDDDFLYYKFTSGSTTGWAWPDEVDCSSTGSSKAPTESTTALKVKQIQQKLNIYYQQHIYFPLAVDGKWGPKTCYAAYGYQREVLGSGLAKLSSQFFTSMGLPEVWSTTFGNSCLSWYQDVPGPGPAPVPPEPTPEPSGPFPWKEMLIGAAGGTLVGLAGKKTVLKKSRVPTVAAAAGGAVLGALGGFVAGKMRS